MSINTALGRYFQLNPDRLKSASQTVIRCPKGCKLAEVIMFPFRGETARALLVYANTRNQVTKRNPLGVNAVALAQSDLDQSDSEQRGIAQTALIGSIEQMIEALHSGRVTESQLEALYRDRGLPLGKIAYVATADDLQPNRHSPNSFARCSHVSVNLTLEHLYARGRSVRLDTTP